MSILQDTDQRWWDLFSRRQAAEHQTLRDGLGGGHERGNGADHTERGEGSVTPGARGPGGNGHANGRAVRQARSTGESGSIPDLALRLLATHTAFGWAHSWPPAARQRLLGPLGLSSRQLSPDNGAAETVFPLGVLGPLLRTGPSDNGSATAGPARDSAELSEAMRRATDALPLALPTELLLSQSGDHRIIPDPQTGLNNYGCRPCPTPGVAAWGSCSANSPSPRAFEAAEQCRRQMLLATVRSGDLADPGEQTAASIRRRLRDVLQLDAAPDCRIVLTPSGTDAEYLCTLLAFGDEPAARLVNLVVAPKEIGSGSGLAAAGEHISNIAPTGCQIPKGAPLAGFPVDRLEVQAVGVRNDRGLPRSVETIERDLAQRIDRAIASGARVLLHLVDSSKTGLTRPSLEFATAMRRRHGERLSVVVDAAQGRFDLPTLHAYVRAGCLVILSGSKFYAGPSFSGAVLVPAEPFAHEPQAAPPRGLNEYLTRAELPTDWTRWRAALRRVANPALMMRWHGALAEMQAYHALDPAVRRASRDAIATLIMRTLAAHPAVHLEPPTAPALGRGAVDGPSIFTFSLRRPGGGMLGHDAARLVYRLMSRDAVDELPPDADPVERRAAGRLFNIGQPLCFGADRRGAFRLAISAPMVTGLAACADGTDWFARRLEPDARALEALLTKLTALARRHG